ncbi:Ubiquitin-conjugating enzyme E2 J1 [Polyplax serrata]|uniref:Ubiquitin-conjugating enzyme E2 J1 n=1 Tax=Polyplax serrata TaxID=468196 RepID=A0ABR1ADH1_POLSC
MDVEQKYNIRNPAVKRLMREACELSKPTDEYFARPLEDNLFEWHFTVHGPPTSEYEGGVYHGRILLPTEYPMKPPNIILLTPNGRFETHKKICLSITGYHPETWQPSWSIRTALLALIAFMSSPGNGAIGSLEYTPEERRVLAMKSRNWECNECGKVVNLLSTSKCEPLTEEESNLINRIALKAEDSRVSQGIESQSKEIGREEENVSGDFSRQSGNQIPRASLPLNETPELVESSENNNLTALMWFVIAAIVLIIARRLFLL